MIFPTKHPRQSVLMESHCFLLQTQIFFRHTVEAPKCSWAPAWSSEWMRTDAGHGFCLHPSSSSTGLRLPQCLPVFLSVVSPVCLPADQSQASKQYTSCFQVCGSPSSLCLLITAGLWKQVYKLDTVPFPWQPQTTCFLAWCISGSSSYLSSISVLSLDSCSLTERRCSLQLKFNKCLLTYLKKTWFL